MGMAANKYLKSSEPINGAGKPYNALGIPVRSGDVLWCAFPFHDTPNQPGPKPRPCLVVEQRAIAGRLFLLVAYGTTQKIDSRDRWPGDVVVGPADGEHFEATGLDSTGKFRLSQLALLPAEPRYFPWPSFRVTTVSKRPVEGCRIGKLTPLMLEVVVDAWRGLRQFQASQAEHGMVPADPIGPLASADTLATGRHGLRPRVR